MKIAPSILSADFSKLGEEIRLIEKAGADIVHIDVMDGHFVPNITIGPSVVKSLRKVTKLPFDVHLMIENPERYIQDFIDAGSDHLTVHVETATHLHRTISLIKEKGIKAGISVNPATPLLLLKEIIKDVDLLLVMTVNPGFGGQKFIDSMLHKIKEAKALIDSVSSNVLLEVDGGINLQNIKSICEAGTDIVVAGSSIFHSKDYNDTITTMKTTINDC